MRVERPEQSFFSNWAGPFTEVTKDLLTICFKGQGERKAHAQAPRATLHCHAVSVPRSGGGEHTAWPKGGGRSRGSCLNQPGTGLRLS